MNVTVTPPNGQLFAAVQLDVPDPAEPLGHRIIGAAPAFRVEVERDEEGKIIRRWMMPLPRVQVVLCNLQPDDRAARAVWAYEDSTVPNEEVDLDLTGGAQRPRQGRRGAIG